MATYSITTTAKQDTILAACAAKRGVTAGQFVNGELARLMQRAKNEYEIDEAAQVASAYTAASQTVQDQVKTALGVT